MTLKAMNLKKENLPFLLDRISVFYTLAVLIYQLAYTLVPVRQFLNMTGLTIVSSLLAVAGIAIAGANLLFNRKVYKAKSVLLLIALLGVMGISTLLNFNYGFIQNVKTILWQAALLLVVFTCNIGNEADFFKKAFKWTYWILTAFYLPAVIVSLCQYYFNIHYITEVEMGTVRQGFIEGRLFGVFSSPHFAAISTVILIIASIYYFLITKKTILRVFLAVFAVLNFIYTVLSGSRSATLALCATVLVASFAIFYKRVLWESKMKKGVRALAAIGLAILVTAGTYAAFEITSGVNVFVLKQINGDISSDSPDEISPEDELMYEREDIEGGNISNNRFTIWKEYIEVAVGDIKTTLFGASPGSYMIYTAENYPDKYIVSHIKESAPSMYERGIIYDTHNAYISAFVSTGVIGFGILLAFLVICAAKALKHIFSKKTLSLGFVLALSLVIFTLAVSFFDSDLFYKCTGTAVTFWLFCGLLIKQTRKEEPEKTDSEEN